MEPEGTNPDSTDPRDIIGSLDKEGADSLESLRQRLERFKKLGDDPDEIREDLDRQTEDVKSLAERLEFAGASFGSNQQQVLGGEKIDCDPVTPDQVTKVTQDKSERQSFVPPESEVVTDPEIIDPLVELLVQGEVEKFNALRPAGRLDFRNEDLAGLDLTGADLRYIDFTQANLNRCNLTNALCQHAVFDRSLLQTVKLDGARFFESSFEAADLSKTLSAVATEFHKCNFESAHLANGNFSGSVFTDALLVSAKLTDAKFVKASMRGANLTGSRVSRADFNWADLHKANLSLCTGRDVNFVECNLTDATAIKCALFSSTKEEVRTNFTNAWTKGLIHQGAIDDSMLAGAINKFPPEPFFEQAPEADHGIQTIDGIPNSNLLAWDTAMSKLSRLIGHKSAKQAIKLHFETLKNSDYRSSQLGLSKFEVKMHALILGDAGTGKSTLLEIVALANYALGLTNDPNPVRGNKSSIVAGYEGQTPIKTNEWFDSIRGKTAGLDEIYSLDAERSAFSADALSVIADRMELEPNACALNFLGYKKEMMDMAQSNSGIMRRFTIIDAETPTHGELTDIYRLQLDEVDLSKYDSEFIAWSSILLAASRELRTGRFFGNGGDAKNIVMEVARRLSEDINAAGNRDDLEAQQTPLVEHLPFEDTKLLGIPRDEFIAAFPDLSEFTWVDEEGKEYTASELPIEFDYLEGKFPSLSKESVKKLKDFVESKREDTLFTEAYMKEALAEVEKARERNSLDQPVTMRQLFAMFGNAAQSSENSPE